MKEKMIKLFKTRRDLVVFSLILLVSIITVGLIAKFSIEGDDVADPVTDIIEPEQPIEDEPKEPTEPIDPKEPEKETQQTFIQPISGDYTIVRQYFDIDNTETMADAIIVSGTYRRTSKGIGFAKSDNSEFNVICNYQGTVTSIEETGLYGTCVTIDHGSNVVSKYYALSSYNVSVGDVLDQGDIIGVSGTSIVDQEAGNYVYLEILVNGEYYNPLNVVDKEIAEINQTEK